MQINTEKLTKLLAAIEYQANKKGGPMEEELAVIDDWAGGNVDDAYYTGVRDGEISFARDLMEILK